MYQGLPSFACPPGGRYYVGPYGVQAVPAERSDDEIRNEILSRLQADPWVNEQAISVEVRQGAVTLTGEVDVMNEKRTAGDDAWDTPGVMDVNNQVSVSKLEPLTRARRQPPTRRRPAEGGRQPRQEGPTRGGRMPRTRQQ
jgi:hypothetical protein